LLCRGGAEKLNGIWEPAIDSGGTNRRAATQRAFLATGKSYAITGWEYAAKALDDYARGWAQMFDDSCTATHVTGEQSSQVLDLRTDCLNEALNGLRAVSDLFAGADAAVVIAAGDAGTAGPRRPAPAPRGDRSRAGRRRKASGSAGAGPGAGQ
jgi:serine/threonine-protein kinase